MKNEFSAAYILAGLSALLGLLFSFWPLALVGVVCAALSGRTFFAVTLGLFFDLMYGAPDGLWTYLPFPFVLCALVCFALRFAAMRYMIEHESRLRI